MRSFPLRGKPVLALCVALILSAVLAPAGAQEDPPRKETPRNETQARPQRQDDGRVRAKEPTVVTVRGKQSQVEEDQAPQPRGVGSKIKSGAAAAWNGVVGFTGWLFNTKDDIPSERERGRRQESEQRHATQP
jgi:hypothetical protein